MGSPTLPPAFPCRRPVACWTAWLLAFVGLILPASAVAVEAEPPANSPLYFESHIRSILKTHCFHCHGEEPEVQGRLDVRLVRWLTKGGESGPAVVPGKLTESLIWKRIESGEMPPKGKGLSEIEKQTIARWIDQGALTRRPEPESLASESPWTEEERSFWSFQKVVRPAIPAVTNASAPQSAIDQFLLANLEKHQLDFTPLADRATLARRVSLDLCGLPLAPELLADFIGDLAPDAYERLVDRLLASPAYGERWGRHWLDTAGYADSDGYTETDALRQWAFRYRDYVIASLNADKPFDQFVIEQLAGDELVTPPYENLSTAAAEKIAATGFLRMGPDGTGDAGVDANVARNDCVAETLKIVSTSLLGLTVGCAQCHDHRYDPISQTDYYRFRAIFEPALDWKNWREKPARLVNLWQPEDKAAAVKNDQELAELEAKRLVELDAIVAEVFDKEVAKLPEEKRELAKLTRTIAADKRTPEQLALIKEYPSLNVDRGSVVLYDGARVNEFNKRSEEQVKTTRAKRPADSFVACLTEVPGQIPVTKLFFRGDINQPRADVLPGDLSILGNTSAIPVDDPALPTSGRRLALAKYLTTGQHPLVGRVLVNRGWLHLFGQGLVTSPGDFGYLGHRPTHPELLDWLADEFVQTGWQLKRLHRRMVCSRAYQQSSVQNERLQALDPENRWFGRMSVRRLQAEAIRDAMLEVAGVTIRQMEGPAAPVNPDDVGQAIVGSAIRDGNGLLVASYEDLKDQNRRSIYIQVRRSLPLGMLEPFDTPTLSPNCDQRTFSTVAPQSLLLMNNRTTILLSERFAARVLRDVAADDTLGQVRRAWELAAGKTPSPSQAAQAVTFVQAQTAWFTEKGAQGAEAAKAAGASAGTVELSPQQQALAIYCQALFSSNLFLYVD